MAEELLPSLGRALLFLGAPCILLIFYFQWRWANTCANNIRVLVAQKGGGGAFMLAPKEGGAITITNPKDDSTRVWPINELATIDVLYPGIGFMPAFLQKTIRLAIVNEGDWEPMLNRSPHREKTASPDVIEFLQIVATKCDSKMKADITSFAKDLATGPTREMIADPAMLGNLIQSSIMKALATVSTDLMDVLKTLNAKLGKVMGPNPTIVYIGLGLIAILVVFTVFKVVPLADDIGLIKQHLGVVGG